MARNNPDYLGTSEYRIHGSNELWTMGHDRERGFLRATIREKTAIRAKKKAAEPP